VRWEETVEWLENWPRWFFPHYKCRYLYCGYLEGSESFSALSLASKLSSLNQAILVNLNRWKFKTRSRFSSQFNYAKDFSMKIMNKRRGETDGWNKSEISQLDVLIVFTEERRVWIVICCWEGENFVMIFSDSASGCSQNENNVSRSNLVGFSLPCCNFLARHELTLFLFVLGHLRNEEKLKVLNCFFSC
jgi:hypothetical protein